MSEASNKSSRVDHVDNFWSRCRRNRFLSIFIIFGGIAGLIIIYHNFFGLIYFTQKEDDENVKVPDSNMLHLKNLKPLNIDDKEKRTLVFSGSYKTVTIELLSQDLYSPVYLTSSNSPKYTRMNAGRAIDVAINYGDLKFAINKLRRAINNDRVSQSVAVVVYFKDGFISEPVNTLDINEELKIYLYEEKNDKDPFAVLPMHSKQYFNSTSEGLSANITDEFNGSFWSDGEGKIEIECLGGSVSIMRVIVFRNVFYSEDELIISEAGFPTAFTYFYNAFDTRLE